jgi:hypothetical protein
MPYSCAAADNDEKGDYDNDEEDLDDPDKQALPLQTGYLNKKGQHGSWKKRYFVLKSGSMYYYKDKKVGCTPLHHFIHGFSCLTSFCPLPNT